MTRRELLACLAAGGAVVAGELWFPSKLISIPSGNIFTANANSVFVGDVIAFSMPSTGITGQILYLVKGNEVINLVYDGSRWLEIATLR